MLAVVCRFFRRCCREDVFWTLTDFFHYASEYIIVFTIYHWLLLNMMCISLCWAYHRMFTIVHHQGAQGIINIIGYQHIIIISYATSKCMEMHHHKTCVNKVTSSWYRVHQLWLSKHHHECSIGLHTLLYIPLCCIHHCLCLFCRWLELWITVWLLKSNCGLFMAVKHPKEITVECLV